MSAPTRTPSPAVRPVASAQSAPRSLARIGGLSIGVLALVAYVPLLLTHPGMVGADTKQYLYLDPSRMLSHVISMWDPHVGMGTVTHQNIGYLVPMGPWYWTLHTIGLPVWVAQRLWIGTLLFLAGLGTVFLLRTLGWQSGNARTDGGDALPDARPERSLALHGGAVMVGALAYMLTPYVLEYEARISAILMPWSALPWMVALVIRALRTRGWRYPALFALIPATAGSVNATSLIYAGIAPVLWFPFAVWVFREVPLGRAVKTFVRIGLLSTLTSLWWMSGLLTQATNGLDVLRYTETIKVVAATGLSIEILRGLGNWYFYGRDQVGPWVQPASQYTQQLWRLALSFLVPDLAMVSAIAVRWRYKLYFVTLVAVGTAIAVGVHPYQSPPPMGAAFKSFANSSSAGLALRSVGRAVPLVALGLAVLLGCGLDAMVRAYSHRARLVTLAMAVVGVLVAVNMAPLFTGQFINNELQRPEHIPAYWTSAARSLDQKGSATRVLELPGADFSHYRWGTTLDPVTPGLMDRPFVSRELIPYGSAPSADLIRALDGRLQNGIFEPASLAPIARLMGVGDVVLRSDLQYERFLTPLPRPTWQLFNPAPAGLAAPNTFGPPVPSNPVIPVTNEITLATPPSAPDPPAVAIYGVKDPLPIVRTQSSEAPLVVAGDGEGLVDLAAAGVLDQRDANAGPIFYAADLVQDPAAMRAALASGADLVVTDTNRRRAQRWGTIHSNNGYTEQAGEQPLVNDPSDNRLPLFPGATDDSATVAQQRGVSAVRATSFGDPVAYAPGERPDQALDGDVMTAWEAQAFSNPVGQNFRIDLAGPVTTDHVGLVQPVTGPVDRYITKATLRFDGGSPIAIDLSASSRTPAGQTVTFPSRTFHRLDITVDAINLGLRADYRGGSAVGFAEVRIPGVSVDEVLRLPTDLLTAAGASSIDHRLTVVLTRKRSDPQQSFITDEELNISRTFNVPTGRSFSLTGTARLSAAANDQAIDTTLGRPSVSQGAVVASAPLEMPGDLSDRAWAAFDGDPTTAWTRTFGNEQVAYIDVTTPHPFSADHLDLTAVADGQHSVPTQLDVSVDGGPSQRVAVPPIADATAQNATTTVRVPLTPVSGTHMRVTVAGERIVRTKNYFSAAPQALPFAIAELGIPGVHTTPPAGNMPAGCRTDLLTIDGKPIPLRVTGTQAAAIARQPLDVQPCDGPIVLEPGSHEVRSRAGRDSGMDLDRLLLRSDRGGAPSASMTAAATSPDAAAQLASSPAPTQPPAVKILKQGDTSATVSVDAPAGGKAFWLVFGQSHNTGWTARVAGPNGHSLGAPALVNGYANAWLVQPKGAGPMTIILNWTPQRRVVIALGLSALAVLACLILALVPRRRLMWSTAGDLGARTTSLPVVPTLSSPLWPTGRPARRRMTVLIAVLTTVLGIVVIAPVPGIIVGAAATIVLLKPRVRPLVSVGAVLLFTGSALYVVQLQLRYYFPAKIEWPEHFDRIALIPSIAVAFLVVDAIVEHVRSRRRH